MNIHLLSRSSHHGMALLFLVTWYSLLVSTCQSFAPSATTTANNNRRRAEERRFLLHATTVTAQEDTTTTDDFVDSKPALLNSLFPNDRQILRFQEPKTNVTVMLVGSMHYNPASIRLVENTVESLAKSNQLASVIIESCDIRWNKTQELLDKKKAKQRAGATPIGNDKDFLGNEMRAAWEVATKFNRPTVLGDQRINITTDALKSSLKETTYDLVFGGPSGWERSRDEIAENWAKTIPISTDRGEYLNAVAFFDPRLLICLPVSLVKYPLSFLVKDPIPFGTLFALLAALNFYGGGGDLPVDWTDFSSWAQAAMTQPIKEYPLTDYVLSFGIAVLETIVFGRLLLKPLLADRNEILAKSVLDQCKIYASSSTAPSPGWFQRFFPALETSSRSINGEEIIYVPGSDPETMKKLSKNTVSSDEKVVVAVLGMAHCNGVMKLLKEQRV